MSKNSSQFETLLQDLDRVKRRQKICKKAVQEDISSIINVLQHSVNEINNDIAMDEVRTYLYFPFRLTFPFPGE